MHLSKGSRLYVVACMDCGYLWAHSAPDACPDTSCDKGSLTRVEVMVTVDGIQPDPNSGILVWVDSLDGSLSDIVEPARAHGRGHLGSCEHPVNVTSPTLPGHRRRW